MHSMDTPSPTPRSTPRPTFDNLDPQKRQRVLEESLREFAEKGYHQASINCIAGRLSIAKGSFFQYFGSKEGLFRHLFARAVDEIKAPLKTIRDADSAEPFALRLRRVFVTGAAFARAHPLIWRVYRRMVTQDDFPLRELLLSQVRAEALDEHLMLRAHAGHFCAGEMLDWEAPTGGYLLTAALASGRVAGLGAARWLQQSNAES